MTEPEYITAANLARLRAAHAIMQQIVPGYGITHEDGRELLNKIDDAISLAYRAVEISPESTAPAEGEKQNG